MTYKNLFLTGLTILLFSISSCAGKRIIPKLEQIGSSEKLGCQIPKTLENPESFIVLGPDIYAKILDTFAVCYMGGFIEGSWLPEAVLDITCEGLPGAVLVSRTDMEKTLGLFSDCETALQIELDRQAKVPDPCERDWHKPNCGRIGPIKTVPAYAPTRAIPFQ